MPTPRRAALALPLLALPARAQGFPSRPVRLVVGFAPGGSTDILARALQQPLSEAWGQPVVVENRTGASGLLATENVVRAAPDGHSLAFVISTHATAPALVARMPFDALRDVTPVALVARMRYVLVTAPTSPFRTLAELLEGARRRPGALAFGSTGIGTSHHLAMEMLLRRAGVEMTHVAYRGGGAAVAAVTTGEVATMLATWPTAVPLVQGRQLRALAVSAPGRAAALPEVPAAAESFPGFDAAEWYGVLGPAGLPAPVVAVLREGLAAATARPEVAARFAALGIEADVGTPAGFARLIQDDMARFGALIRELGLRPE